MSSEEVSREVAWRMFAREYDDSDLSFKEGDDERAPNYVATPTGAKVNRLFAVGVLTEVERVGDGDLLRARVSDPTGAFVVYAGQYQPDAVSFLADAETPSFVAVVGKARTYEPEDSDDVYTSIRPEGMNAVDPETRDRWNVETARETLKRVEAVRDYLRAGVTPETRPPLHELGEVVDHYGTDEPYLDELEREARDVLTEVAGVEAGTGTGAGGDRGGVTGAAEAGAETSGPTAETQTEAVDEATDSETADASEDDSFDDIEQEEVGDWEWDEGQREEVEEEFGAEFESGAEFADEEEDTEEGTEEPPESEDADEDAEEDEEESQQEGPEETDESAESVVMEVIESENGEEGAERATIIQEAAERGIDEEVAEATLEDLLLEGMCYPTDGDRIKPL